MLSQVGTADLPRAPIKSALYLILVVVFSFFVNYAVHCTLDGGVVAVGYYPVPHLPRILPA